MAFALSIVQGPHNYTLFVCDATWYFDDVDRHGVAN